MHSSERVDVYLPATTTTVIEKCTGVCFSVYPANPPVSTDGPKNVSHYIRWETRACVARRELNGCTQEFRVEDFSHIRQTPSPNWTLRNDEMVALDHWLKKFRDSGRGASEWDPQILADILARVCGERSE